MSAAHAPTLTPALAEKSARLDALLANLTFG